MMTLEGLKDIKRVINRLINQAPQATLDGLNAFGIAVQSQARRNLTDLPAVDTGRLRSSIKVEDVTRETQINVRVGTDVNYAAAVEFGSKPHFPPLEPIREWCRRHNIPESAAYAIALNISRNGQAAKPYLFPAYEQERPNFQEYIKEGWRRLDRELP